MPHNNRVIILGLDGASLKLVEKWADAGELPYFDELMKEGGWGLLRSTPNFGSASAWPSFYTGLNPGRHGMFDFLYREEGSYRLRWMTKRYFSGKPFWKIAGEQGVRSAIVNMPVTYPVDEFNGIQVAGWMTPNTAAKGFTFPKELAGEIEKKVGKHIFAPSVKAEVNRGDYTAAIESLRRSFDYKKKLCRYLMKQYPAQIFAHAWIATDQVGHYFWHLIDPQHPQYDADLARRYGDAILEIYKRSDRAVRELHEAFGGALVIMSDHGHGPNSRGHTHYKSLLNKSGFMEYKESDGKSRFNALVSRTFDILQGFLGRRIKRFLIAHFPQAVDFAFTKQNLSDINWTGTTVYHNIEPTVNLKGREPQGIVESAQAGALLSEVENILLSARDTRSGKPAVKTILRKEDAYHGDFLHRSPDLVVVWNNDIVVEKLEFTYQGKKIITEPHYTDHRTGNHTPQGIFFIKGEGVKKGFRSDTARIIDLCSTILYLAGCGIPQGLDGRLLEEFITSEQLSASPPEYLMDSGMADTAAPDYATEEEKRAAEKRLKDLGYL